MITGVHHVSYTVSDVERSIAFYRDGLGFEVLNDRVVGGEMPAQVTGLAGARLRVVHLRGYGIGLELIQYLGAAGSRNAPRTCDVGSSHVCFIVDDIDVEIARLRDAGARFLSEPATVDAGPNAGNRFLYFLDPDGIPMELTERRGGARGRSG